MKKKIAVVLICSLVLLLIGCAKQGAEQGGVDGAETEQIAQQEDRTEKEKLLSATKGEGEPAEEELQPFPEDELHNIFDIAYSSYEPMSMYFSEEESIGYEMYDIMKMVSQYEGIYLIPSEADIEAKYRAWRPTAATSSLPEESTEGESKTVQVEQPSDTTPTVQTPPQQTPPQQTPPQQTPPKTVDLSQYSTYNGQPIDTDYLGKLMGEYPELSVEEILSEFGYRLYVRTPEQQAIADDMAELYEEAAEQWFGSN